MVSDQASFPSQIPSAFLSTSSDGLRMAFKIMADGDLLNTHFQQAYAMDAVILLQGICYECLPKFSISIETNCSQQK
ncbi:hypothetical protein SUGI_0188210 [Cryptomeria japonica]|nr:hypothetical protein SUGI_0188210 [Cryptomeria japonica]